MSQQRSQRNNNEFHLVVEQGSLEQIKQLLQNISPEELNSTNKQGQNALHLAVKSCDEETIRLLIKYGCEIDKGNLSGQTPLFLACWLNKPNIVRLLLSFQANINKQDNRGWTSLMISSYNGLMDIVKVLLENGADPRVEDSFGKRPLDRAKDQMIIKMLLNATDEFNLASVPLNQSPKTKIYVEEQQKRKTPQYTRQVTDEDNSISSTFIQKRNQSVGPQKEQKSKYVGVKDVENVTQMRQYASQLVAQSQTQLQNSIQTFMDVSLQKHIAQYEQELFDGVYQRFEQRLYITFNCLTEYLALKLRVGLAHLGVKVPEDIFVDYQSQGSEEFQEGFNKMVKQESKRLKDLVLQLEGKERRESENLSNKIYNVASTIGVSIKQDDVVINHLQQSFQEICQRIFIQSTQQIKINLQEYCPQIEQKVEQHIENLIDKTEREMKVRVEGIVQKCLGDVKDKVDEVDGWIQRKEHIQQRRSEKIHNVSQDMSTNPSQRNLHNRNGNLQDVFQQQNMALKDKINQLKLTLSPKNYSK